MYAKINSDSVIQNTEYLGEYATLLKNANIF